MGEVIGFNQTIVRYSGLFDFEALYLAWIDWIKRQEYSFVEKAFKHSGSSGGAEQELELEGKRNTTEYVQYIIKIKMHSWDVKEVEIVQDGHKKIVYQGKIEVRFAGNVETDWQKKFEKGTFSKFLKNVYEKYIIGRELGAIHGGNVYSKVWNLHAITKTFFDMQTKKGEF